MAGVPDMIRILAVDDHPLLRKGIAALGNAESTVKSHVTNILSKLSANDRAHAVTIGT
jgi:DNA-binding NarL/FixJ family response regulator